ncbi:aldo/keto reductase [Candidatus Neomarinimicrobiota bacterium]
MAETNMEKRVLGRTDHRSTVAVFGAGALAKVDQSVADQAMEQVIAAGVNHIDVAPSYGEAESRLKPWMIRARDKFFLGCKTLERKQGKAAEELHGSLERLGVSHFDLYQFHAVNDLQTLDDITAPGGALEAVIAAREAGLVRFIGITGHGLSAPTVFQEALRRFDFDTVMFPINAILYQNRSYRQEARALLGRCRDQSVGTIIIKAVAQGPWDTQDQPYHTWYKPFDAREQIQSAIDFVLSQEMTSLATPSDHLLLPLVLDACEHYSRLSSKVQQRQVTESVKYEMIFAERGRIGLD